jgi:hypothetical protein
VELWPCDCPYGGAAATRSPRPQGDGWWPRPRPVRVRPWAKSVTYLFLRRSQSCSTLLGGGSVPPGLPSLAGKAPPPQCQPHLMSSLVVVSHLRGVPSLVRGFCPAMAPKPSRSVVSWGSAPIRVSEVSQGPPDDARGRRNSLGAAGLGTLGGAQCAVGVQGSPGAAQAPRVVQWNCHHVLIIHPKCPDHTPKIGTSPSRRFQTDTKRCFDRFRSLMNFTMNFTT